MSSTYRSQTPQSQRPASSSTTADGNNASSSTTGSSKASGNKDTSTPFVANSHGHPSFNAVKTGTKGSGDSKTPKQPKAPDKPLMPYMRYSRKVWDSVKASNPDLKLWEIGKIIGQMWRELSDDEKQEYLDEYDAEKLQYTEALKAYHNSPAYQSWLSAKGKCDQEAESEEPEKTRRSKAPAAGSAAASHVADSKSITMQPCEEDDDNDDSYSIKHVAAARFHRNHCLINEIFSDAVVPDVRTVINEGRMSVLKRQVLSLTMHQKKLEGELEIIEQKHTSKKGQFSQNSERFYEDLAKVCNDKPQVTEDQFSTMVVKAKDELREKQRLALINQQQQQQQQLLLQQQQQVETAEKTVTGDANDGVNTDVNKNGLENGAVEMKEVGSTDLQSNDIQAMETDANDKSSQRTTEDPAAGVAVAVQDCDSVTMGNDSDKTSTAIGLTSKESTTKDEASAGTSSEESLPTSTPCNDSEVKLEQPDVGKSSEALDVDSRSTTKGKDDQEKFAAGGSTSNGSEGKASSETKRKHDLEDMLPSKHSNISSSTESADKPTENTDSAN